MLQWLLPKMTTASGEKIFVVVVVATFDECLEWGDLLSQLLLQTMTTESSLEPFLVVVTFGIVFNDFYAILFLVEHRVTTEGVRVGRRRRRRRETFVMVVVVVVVSSNAPFSQRRRVIIIPR